MRSKARLRMSNGKPNHASATGRPARSTVRSQLPPDKLNGQSDLTVSKRVTKQAQMIAMLRRPQGISIAAIAAEAGWQRHSVRGFFAAVVKKRFGFDLTYRKGKAGERLYRIDLLLARSSEVIDRDT